jgi:hypothetical protein
MVRLAQVSELLCRSSWLRSLLADWPELATPVAPALPLIKGLAARHLRCAPAPACLDSTLPRRFGCTISPDYQGRSRHCAYRTMAKQRREVASPERSGAAANQSAAPDIRLRRPPVSGRTVRRLHERKGMSCGSMRFFFYCWWSS